MKRRVEEWTIEKVNKTRPKSPSRNISANQTYGQSRSKACSSIRYFEILTSRSYISIEQKTKLSKSLMDSSDFGPFGTFLMKNTKLRPAARHGSFLS